MIDINNLYSVNDTLNNRQSKVHTQLFNDAINKYLSIDSNKELLNLPIDENINNETLSIKYLVIDLNDGETYLDSSHALFISKFRPLKKIKVDLKSYWNKLYVDIYQKIIEGEELLINEENIKDSEFEYVDFVNGKIYYRNKFTNKVFGISFEKFKKKLQINQLKNI